jgi:hypothetical protein
MARCFRCKTEMGAGGVVQENGTVLCQECDQQRRQPPPTRQPKRFVSQDTIAVIIAAPGAAAVGYLWCHDNHGFGFNPELAGAVCAVAGAALAVTAILVIRHVNK